MRDPSSARPLAPVETDTVRGRLLTDGGEADDDATDDSEGGSGGADDDEGTGDERGVGEGRGEDGETAVSDERAADDALDRSTVEVTGAGEAEPADPTWEKPDVDDIPEFEIGATQPPASGGRTRPEEASSAGMPNDARAPGDAGVASAETEAYLVAIELCARLPDDVRLPAEATDLVPAALEAELEQDVQAFASAEFDNPTPTVDTLAFVERDSEIWLRLRLGAPPSSFEDLEGELDVIRAHALERLESLF